MPCRLSCSGISTVVHYLRELLGEGVSETEKLPTGHIASLQPR